MRSKLSHFALAFSVLMALLFSGQVCAQSLPAGWTDGDVGAVGIAGSATYANGTFTIKGSGQGIGGSADAANFLYQSLSGDGTIIARLVSLQGGGSYPQAGVMIRETLNANAATALTEYQNGGITFWYRSSTGGSTGTWAGPSVTVPYWVKVVRSGSTFTSYSSSDGVTWSQVGYTSITMAQSVYIGFSVASNNNSASTTAIIDNVSVVSSTLTAPVVTGISPGAGQPGTQVVISGSGFGTSQGSSVVDLNGFLLTVNSWSATSITVTVPAGAIPGPLAVLAAPSMNASNPEFFNAQLSGSWLNQDIGSVGLSGSAGYVNGTFVINGSGQYIYDVADGMHFVYQPLSGDCTIVARVANVQSATTYPQSGVMIRETLNSNSADAYMSIQLVGQFSARFFDRPSTGSSTNYAVGDNVTLPYWVKLTRSGNSFTGYSSPDGLTWVQVGSATMSMATNVYVGLAVSSDSNGGLSTATFDSVSVTSSAGEPVISGTSATQGLIGNQITISGSGFGSSQGNSIVTLNGAVMTVNAWSATSITATVAPGATSGPLGVSVLPSENASNAVNFTVLPTGWTEQSIGSAGNASYANGLYTVQDAGAGIQGTSDGFNFTSQTLTGDGSITARVMSASTSVTQAGIMIRETLDPASKNVFLNYQNGQNGNPSIYLTYRASSGASTSSPANLEYPILPYWIRIVRSGNNFNAYTSSDGMNWSQLGSTQTITMANAVYIGLAAASQNSSVLATATFDNLSISPVTLPAPIITSLSTSTGPVGTTVTITGTNFGSSQGGGVVLLNDVSMTVNSWSATSITVTIPTGAVSGPMVVCAGSSQNASNPKDFDVTSSPLPSGWLDQDIGTVGVEGSATFASGIFTVQAGGTSIENNADGFNFVYQPLTSDGSIVARVTSSSTASAQVGVMIRETLDTASTNLFNFYETGNSGSYITLFDRPTTGASTSTLGNVQYPPLPYWIKVARNGSDFSGYTSLDGVSWTQVGTFQGLNMQQSVYIGLGVSSQNTNALATATFDSVSVNSSSNPAPVINTLSASTGPVGTQVVISGSGYGATQGNSVVLLNDAAVTVNSWAATSITVTIPTGATSGPLIVSVAPTRNDSNPVSFSVTTQPLVSGWLDQDIGSVGVAGSATSSSGVLTVIGAGNGIGTGTDAFHFVYQPLTTNGSIVARVVSTSANFTQAGVMMRETLSPTSNNAFAFYVNEAGNGAFSFFSYRTLPYGPTSQTGSSAGLPCWVKISRAANQFTGFVSSDGVNWTQVGSPQTFVTAQTVYVGLAVSSGNVAAASTATFDNISITPGASLPNPVITGISPVTGAPGTTVTITGSGFGATQGTSTVMFNGAVATAITGWSDSSVVAIVPDAVSNGPVSVQVGNITAQGPIFTLSFSAQLTDSLGNQSTYTAQPFGQQWRVYSVQGSGCSTCAIRGNTTNQYDANGNPFAATDAMGNVTYTRYDSNNNLIQQTAQLNTGTTANTSYTYNGFGEVLTATDALGHVTTNTYDTHGNLTSVTTPSPDGGTTPGSVTQFAYNSLGELTQITDPLNNITTITYYPTGLIHTITDMQNNVTTYGYDSHGNRTSVQDANSNTTTFAYDAGDRLTTITYSDAGHTTTTFGYDYRGRRHTVTDQNGKVTTYNYDDADRLTSVVDAATNTTTYGYDTESNLISIEDANSHTTSFDYDEFGRVTKTTFPSTKIETYGYDGNNNLTSKTDRKNQTITYIYDALNRLTKKQYPDSTEVDYIYDLVGKIQSVNDPTGTYGFSYDNMGRLIGTSTSYAFLPSRNFTENYAYDKASNRTGFTDPESGSTSYAYDTLNRLQTLTPPTAFGSGSFGFSYDALSRRTQMTRPNSVATNYTYDNLSRLQSVLHQLSGSTIDGATYTVDNAGNRTAKTDNRTNVTSNYSYDAIYELKTVTQGTNTTESYTYDAVGNRLSSVGVSPYSYNTSNELTSTPSTTYNYDYNGNTTSKTDSTGTTNYTWDFENRLTSVTLSGSGGTVSFKYDPFGRRIYKSSSVGTSIFAYDGDNPIEEINTSGSAVARYMQTDDLDEPLVMLRGSTTSYYEADGLGSITSLTSGAGSLAQTYSYDSFGHQTSSSGSLANPFQYTARESDSESGLYFYRARFYDPQSGRFLSEDPLGGGEDAKPNFYTYASNDPVDRFDPTGLSDLTYVRGIQMIILRDGNGNIVGFYPAGNNVSSNAKNDDGVTPTSPYDPGTYYPGPYHPHPETSDPDGPFGNNGIFLFPRPGCAGCGVHSGRANRRDRKGRKGPQHATNGCIRSTDDLTKKILELTSAGDPLRHLYVQ